MLHVPSRLDYSAWARRETQAKGCGLSWPRRYSKYDKLRGGLASVSVVVRATLTWEGTRVSWMRRQAIMQGVVVGALGVGIGILALFLSLLPAIYHPFGTSMTISGSDVIGRELVYFLLLMAAAAVLVFETGWWSVNYARAIRLPVVESLVASDDPILWQVQRASAMVSLVVALPAALAMIGLPTLVVLDLVISKQALWSPGAMWLLAVIAIYPGLHWLFRRAWRMAARFSGRLLPAYRALTDRVQLNLRGGPANALEIMYAELRQVISLHPAEGRLLLRYRTAAHPVQTASTEVELVEYLAGKIERPKQLYYNVGNNYGRVLLLRGPDLYYLFGVGNGDGEDLVQAFQRFKT